MAGAPLNLRGFSLQEAELAKFTNLGQVSVTGHAAPKTVVTYDINNNPVRIDMYAGAAERTNVRLEELPTSLTALGGASWTFESVGGANKYYVWYFINGTGSDPLLPGRTGIQVTATDSPQDISDQTVAAINASAAGAYVKSFPLDRFNISLYHSANGAVVAPQSQSSLVKLTQLQRGADFRLASRTTVTYDINSNPVEIVRVEF